MRERLKAHIPLVYKHNSENRRGATGINNASQQQQQEQHRSRSKRRVNFKFPINLVIMCIIRKGLPRGEMAARIGWK